MRPAAGAEAGRKRKEKKDDQGCLFVLNVEERNPRMPYLAAPVDARRE
jgi:hypothetical protein